MMAALHIHDKRALRKVTPSRESSTFLSYKKVIASFHFVFVRIVQVSLRGFPVLVFFEKISYKENKYLNIMASYHWSYWLSFYACQMRFTIYSIC